MLRRLMTVSGSVAALGGAVFACVGSDPDVVSNTPSDAGSDTGSTIDPSADGASESGASDSGADVATEPDADVGPCNGTVYCARYVFRTSAPYTGGTIGGYQQADTLCQQSADGVEASPVLKGRKWRAFLSTSAPDGGAVADRLVHGTGPYRLVDGTVVANAWTDLVDGSLDAAISITEKGESIGNSIATWTGSDQFGAAVSKTCSDWTVDDGKFFGQIGLGTATNKQWATGDGLGLSCAGSAGLYCIEH